MRYASILSLLTMTACGSGFTTASEKTTATDDAAPMSEDSGTNGGDHPTMPEASTSEASDPPDVVAQQNDAGGEELSGHADAGVNEAGEDAMADSGVADSNPFAGYDGSSCCLSCAQAYYQCGGAACWMNAGGSQVCGACEQSYQTCGAVNCGGSCSYYPW